VAFEQMDLLLWRPVRVPPRVPRCLHRGDVDAVVESKSACVVLKERRSLTSLGNLCPNGDFLCYPPMVGLADSP
jgi:hypothetical protein